MSARVIRIATRTSPLARYQAELVAFRFRRLARAPEVSFVGVESAGDVDPDSPIRSFMARGAFTTAIDRAVAEGRADVAVHSAKDLPASDIDDGLILAAVPEREDPRDVLIGSKLIDLCPGAVVATGAIRRRVQLAFVRPDLGFIELRGNIGSRIEKLPEKGAVLVARAALLRLKIKLPTAEVLPAAVMLPQVGQGAIALRCRSDDAPVAHLLEEIDNVIAHRTVRAERAFLRQLGGGCDAPVAAHATCADESSPIEIEAMIASSDGHAITRQRHVGLDPEQVGCELADILLTRCGGGLFVDVTAGR